MRKTLMIALILGLTGLAAWLWSTGRFGPHLNDSERLARIGILYSGYRNDFANAPEISPAEALNLFKLGQAVFIDLREPAEREISQIPGALSLQEFSAQHIELKDKTVIAYCTIGYRSGKFSQSPEGQAVKARNLGGGILAWLHAGGSLAGPDGTPATRVHVYGRQWNLAPAAYQAIW